jgi:hypothetical protein
MVIQRGEGGFDSEAQVTKQRQLISADISQTQGFRDSIWVQVDFPKTLRWGKRQFSPQSTSLQILLSTPLIEILHTSLVYP